MINNIEIKKTKKINYYLNVLNDKVKENNSFDFNKELNYGNIGEKLFLNFFKDDLELLDGRKNDFKIIKSDNFIELKTDSYNMSSTNNFFIERYSKLLEKSDGGIWQSLKNNNKYFIYFFPKNLCFYVFKTVDIVEQVENIIKNNKNIRTINVKNKNWITQGYLINRNDLKPLKKIQINLT